MRNFQQYLCKLRLSSTRVLYVLYHPVLTTCPRCPQSTSPSAVHWPLCRHRTSRKLIITDCTDLQRRNRGDNIWTRWSQEYLYRAAAAHEVARATSKPAAGTARAREARQQPAAGLAAREHRETSHGF